MADIGISKIISANEGCFVHIVHIVKVEVYIVARLLVDILP
jgi:hypothetical protein